MSETQQMPMWMQKIALYATVVVGVLFVLAVLMGGVEGSAARNGRCHGTDSECGYDDIGTRY